MREEIMQQRETLEAQARANQVGFLFRAHVFWWKLASVAAPSAVVWVVSSHLKQARYQLRVEKEGAMRNENHAAAGSA
jgi:hypothetical protein